MQVRDHHKPVKHNFTVLCEHAVTDRQGRVSLINVVRNVALAEVPAAIPQLAIVSSFTGAYGLPYSVAIEGPGKREISRGSDLTVTPESGDDASKYVQRSTQVVMMWAPAVFEREGVHYIVVRVGGKVIHREPFAVFISPRPSPEEK